MVSEKRPYQICTITVMDTTDPDIWFNDHGVSSHALNYQKTMEPIVKAANDGQRETELEQLFQQIRKSGKGKRYDCIVGISGGVDSSYLILQAVKHGLRPLAVHFDSGWNSDLAISNMNNIVARLNLDLYTDKVDPKEMQDLQLSFFKASVANCDIPTDHAFPSVAYRQAAKHGIKYILSGSNLSAESILPQSWGYSSSDAAHVKGIQKRFGSMPLKSYPLLGLFKRYAWYESLKGIKTVKPLNLMPYLYADAKQTIADELGWQDYGGKHFESIFTRYFQGYYLPHKFEYDKRRAHYSSLIVSGQMTREEALDKLKDPPYDENLRSLDQAYIAEKLGISVEELESIFAQAPAEHMSYPNNKWVWDLAIKSARGLRKVIPVDTVRKLRSKAR